MIRPTTPPSGGELFEKVSRCDLLRTYQDAFRCATGLPLEFLRPDAGVQEVCNFTANGNPFCQKLNLCEKACQACVSVNHKLTEEAAVLGPATCHCFSGLTASAVPIREGTNLIGFLRTGHVFHRPPDQKGFDRVSATLRRQGLTTEDIEGLREAWFQTRVISPERYQSMLILLISFAEQLSQHAEKLSRIAEGSEPEAVTRARRFIEKNLADHLSLAEVARDAGLSQSHFCRVFKEATGLTLTDYINRRRIEWAKEELLEPETRVSEIAYQIGYQSLSQFNRNFSRFTGNSPTQFRREELGRLLPG